MTDDAGARRVADALRRAAERGQPRGVDALCAAVELRAGPERARRRRRDRTLLVAAVALVGALSGLAGLRGAADRAATDELAAGGAVYAERCAGCHGVAGEGGSGPALAGGVTARAFGDVGTEVAFVRDTAHDQAAGTGAVALTEDEVRAVVRYVRDLPA